MRYAIQNTIQLDPCNVYVNDDNKTKVCRPNQDRRTPEQHQELETMIETRADSSSICQQNPPVLLSKSFSGLASKFREARDRFGINLRR